MAGQLSLRVTLQFLGSPATENGVNWDTSALLISLNGLAAYQDYQVLDTVGKPLPMGGVAGNAGYIIMANEDISNYIDVQPGSGAPGNPSLIELPPRPSLTAFPIGIALFMLYPSSLSPLTYTAPWAKARTGTAAIRYAIVPAS